MAGKKRRKDAHAARMGKKGGFARAAKLTPEQRTEIARKGGLALQAKVAAAEEEKAS